MSEMIDFYINSIGITSLFTDYSEGNAELHELFKLLYVPTDVANNAMMVRQSIRRKANYRFLHRDIYNSECGEYMCKLVASADGSFSDFQSLHDSGTVKIKILSNGQFITCCPICESKTNAFLDVGCIDICEHELALLLGLDYYMSLNNRYNVAMNAKRLEAFKTSSARLEKIKGIDHKKITTLWYGVTNIGKDFGIYTLRI